MNNRRDKTRFEIEPIEIHGMISLGDLTPICDFGFIVEASSTGFKMILKHEDLFQDKDFGALPIDALIARDVSMFIPAMDLDITGKITRTRVVGIREYEIGIDYTQDAPDYWRECLCDLLPKRIAS